VFLVNLPNYLTTSRILSVPLFIWILFTDRISSLHGEKVLLAAAVITLAAITDRLDGYLARKYGLITTTGMLLDPLADKLLIASALIALVQFNPQVVKAWVAVVIIAREFLVTDLRVIAAAEGLTIQARSLGKIKMAVQVIAVVAAILDRRWWNVGFEFGRSHFVVGIDLIAKLAIWVAVLLSVVSAADYFVAFWSRINQSATSHRQPARILRKRRPAQVTTIR
jgi:CDP-diacylglycerol--glycerol-3-phosphate 3-phosphatidyltransferase